MRLPKSGNSGRVNRIHIERRTNIGHPGNSPSVCIQYAMAWKREALPRKRMNTVYECSTRNVNG
jgi:hypothetical protein